MQELISFINWEELRIWLLFLFGIIGGVITIRSFSLNNEQRRIDNTFKVLDFLRRNISKEQINAFITLFQANNPLGVPYDEFHFRNGKTEKVSDMFSEGGCGNGDIHNMIELFELIAPLLIKKQINENLIWYEYGLIMDKCYDWIIVINENNNDGGCDNITADAAKVIADIKDNPPARPSIPSDQLITVVTPKIQVIVNIN